MPSSQQHTEEEKSQQSQAAEDAGQNINNCQAILSRLALKTATAIPKFKGNRNELKNFAL